LIPGKIILEQKMSTLLEISALKAHLVGGELEYDHHGWWSNPELQKPFSKGPFLGDPFTPFTQGNVAINSSDSSTS